MELFFPISIETVRLHRKELGQGDRSASEDDDTVNPSKQSAVGLRRSARLATASKRNIACSICRSIAKVALSEQHLSLKIGRMSEVVSSRCKVHRQILEVSTGIMKAYDPNGWVSVSKNLEREAVNIFLPNNSDDYIGSVSLMPLPCTKEQSCRKHAKLVDPRWVDFRTLRDWMQVCERTHGTLCESRPSPALEVEGPDWVIDVWRRSLVPFRPTMRYCALSYVWGNVKSLRTLNENLCAHQRCGAFGKDDIQIPKVIRESICLTEAIGERYLWVDSLCIVQDNVSKHDQLNKMAYIYAGSCLAFIAQYGNDADHGLPGLPGISEPRDYEQKRFYFSERCRLVTKPPTNKGISPYWTRGWTYQEFRSARRKLVFEKETVYWQCQHDTWREDESIVVKQLPQPDMQDEFSPRWPNLRAYSETVRRYMYRAFTFEEDAYFAFAGIIFEFSKRFPGGFLYGIPEIFFDTALLWQPHNVVAKRPLVQSSTQQLLLPTWSWMAWQGSLESWSWYSGYDYLVVKNSHYATSHTFPVVQWYCQHSLTSPRRPIMANSRMYMQHVWDESGDLPSGWSAHRVQLPTSYGIKDSTPPFRDAPFRQCVFTHESDPNALFWYPIPVVESGCTPLVRKPEPYLSCQTQRCYLRVGKIHDIAMPEVGLPNAHIASLLDSKGGWAGTLQLHTESDKEMLSDVVNANMKLELAVISRGFAYNDAANNSDLLEWNLEERPRSEELYSFYNVLWIEWNGQIAFRKALGRVVITVWDAEGPEPFELVLC